MGHCYENRDIRGFKLMKKLLILSLIIIPFYELFLYFCIPGRSLPMFADMRVTKDFVSLAFAIAIGSSVLMKSGFKPLKSVWIPAFLLFLVWNIYKAPVLGDWNFGPLFKVMSYFFLFLGVSNVEWDQKCVDSIFKTVMWCGFGMAVYMILQKFGMDQIFSAKPEAINGVVINGSTKNAEMGGFVGHPTLAAPFVVMGIPFAIYFKSYILAIIMSICVILSGSSFAILGLAAVFVLMIRKWPVSIGVLAIGLIALYFNHELLNGNGRFEVWKLVLEDIRNGKILLTGAGIGAFKTVFNAKHGVYSLHPWYQAHNEWLQVIWGCGLAGFACVIGIIAEFFRTNKDLTIGISVGAVLLMCFGTFLLQLAVYQFYLTVLFGLTYSKWGTSWITK